MPPTIVDTNILLRHFLQDVPLQSSAIARFLLDAVQSGTRELTVIPSTVSEMVFVARGKTYATDRAVIADIIGQLLEGPFDVADHDVIARAVRLYRDIHDDWDDCLLAAYAIERADGRVVSFDRGLDRIPGLIRIDPAAEARA